MIKGIITDESTGERPMAGPGRVQAGRPDDVGSTRRCGSLGNVLARRDARGTAGGTC